MSEIISLQELRPYCADFSENQLLQAKNICDTYNLTPVKRQIHISLRNKKDDKGDWKKELAFLVTVDGLRSIAERGGSYQGQVGPFWCGEDGVWKDVWLLSTPPCAAKIGVFKSNFREALFAVAKFDEYKQTSKEGQVSGMWQKMPATMIAKCAEALAIRRAFPDETGGIYTVEEMQQAENPKFDVLASPREILKDETGDDGLFSKEVRDGLFVKMCDALEAVETHEELKKLWNNELRKTIASFKKVDDPRADQLIHMKDRVKTLLDDMAAEQETINQTMKNL